MSDETARKVIEVPVLDAHGLWPTVYHQAVQHPLVQLAAAIDLRSLLQRDTGMRAQTIVARRYVPLERLGEGFGGCPVSTEFRVFVLDHEVVGTGFYWPPDDCTLHPPPPPSVIPADFLREAIARVHPRLRFYALDVARTAAGDWIVIEINDGQRAGLSEVLAGDLYPAMDRVLRQRGA